MLFLEKPVDESEGERNQRCLCLCLVILQMQFNSPKYIFVSISIDSLCAFRRVSHSNAAVSDICVAIQLVNKKKKCTGQATHKSNQGQSHLVDIESKTVWAWFLEIICWETSIQINTFFFETIWRSLLVVIAVTKSAVSAVNSDPKPNKHTCVKDLLGKRWRGDVGEPYRR